MTLCSRPFKFTLQSFNLRSKLLNVHSSSKLVGLIASECTCICILFARQNMRMYYYYFIIITKVLLLLLLLLLSLFYYHYYYYFRSADGTRYSRVITVHPSDTGVSSSSHHSANQLSFIIVTLAICLVNAL